MRKFLVRLNNGEKSTIEADNVYVEDGNLLFYDNLGSFSVRLTSAYAKFSWYLVEEDKDEKQDNMPDVPA